MENRRRFLQATAAAAVTSRSVLGANDRIQMGIIGTGWRGMDVRGFFQRHSDCVFVAACDVVKSKLDEAAKTIGGKVDTYSDYRRLLERKDIDAVLVATPDHWHGPIFVDACDAGKDVYVEKPATNNIDAGLAMVDAAHRNKSVSQVGVQQRSGVHFQEAAKLVKDGLLGDVTFAECRYSGGYGGARVAYEDPPADLDWEMFQGPAPRHRYQPNRQRSWRSFYDLRRRIGYRLGRPPYRRRKLVSRSRSPNSDKCFSPVRWHRESRPSPGAQRLLNYLAIR